MQNLAAFPAYKWLIWEFLVTKKLLFLSNLTATLTQHTTLAFPNHNTQSYFSRTPTLTLPNNNPDPKPNSNPNLTQTSTLPNPSFRLNPYPQP